jgi:Mn-dependent DtxR family transcriptional regulator
MAQDGTRYREPNTGKLTADDRAHIEALLVEGVWTRAQLAREFEISGPMVSKIRTRLREEGRMAP